MYLCYDIKGIQQFIFSVPRLRYMIGGSGQISRFDEHWSDPGNVPKGAQCIFSGGGRGVFRCESQAVANSSAKKLISLAHSYGFDIRIGSHEEFEHAMERADELYPYLPSADQLQGFPCSESGLYPVPQSAGRARDNRRVAVHPLIRKRGQLAGEDPLGNLILDRIGARLPDELRKSYFIEFFRNVSPELQRGDETDDSVTENEIDLDRQRAIAGRASLGDRNRWAVVAMDGNSVGRHFKNVRLRAGEREPEAIGKVSNALKELTEGAFDDALVDVLSTWFAKSVKSGKKSVKSGKDVFKKCSYPSTDDSKPRLLVPFRPVLLGGDDLVLLCHCSHAMDFVRLMAKSFEKRSKEVGMQLEQEMGFNPWEASGGTLTISAGVLFAKTSLPLHVAIPYAESLLGSAKGAFRTSDQPTPSAVDWEIVTDTMIDTPTARRKRDLVFLDRDISRTLVLTRRPYQLGSVASENRPNLDDLMSQTVPMLEATPRAFRAQLSTVMARPWSERMEFLCSIAKDPNYRRISRSIELDANGEPTSQSTWCENVEFSQATDQAGRASLEHDVLDAIGILDEQHRDEQETVNQ